MQSHDVLRRKRTARKRRRRGVAAEKDNAEARLQLGALCRANVLRVPGGARKTRGQFFVFVELASCAGLRDKIGWRECAVVILLRR